MTGELGCLTMGLLFIRRCARPQKTAYHLEGVQEVNMGGVWGGGGYISSKVCSPAAGEKRNIPVTQG